VRMFGGDEAKSAPLWGRVQVGFPGRQGRPGRCVRRVDAAPFDRSLRSSLEQAAGTRCAAFFFGGLCSGDCSSDCGFG